MLKNKKGFTLVELLAVIVILAIILAIAIPGVTSLVENSKAKTLESSAKLIINAIHLKKLDDSLFDPTSIDTASEITSVLGLNSENYSAITITMENDKPSIVLVGSNKWDGLTASGTYETMSVSETTYYTDYIVSKGINKPKLATGMTPIKWVSGVETPTTESDADWYDYSNQMWANAKTADGSYWVWIPRYAYQTATCYHMDSAQCTTETGKSVGTINVKFLIDGTNTSSDSTTIETTPTYNGSSQTNYVTHPGFTFGSTELTGIWFAKFESSNNGDKVKVIPNASPWVSISIANIYAKSRAMEQQSTTYGWGGTDGSDIGGLDVHAMKNIEWGAVAYLTGSSYGKTGNPIYTGEVGLEKEVWINPSGSTSGKTGCAGDSLSAAYTGSCLRTYNTTNGQKASSTGNLTGVYDMSGGNLEYVMANWYNKAQDAGIDPATILDKYIDRYTYDSNGYRPVYIGEGQYETSYQPLYYTGSNTGNPTGSWNADNSKLPYSYQSFGFTKYKSWIDRGGYYYSESGAGVFAFGSETGAASQRTFRPVILVANDI